MILAVYFLVFSVSSAAIPNELIGYNILALLLLLVLHAFLLMCYDYYLTLNDMTIFSSSNYKPEVLSLSPSNVIFCRS